MRETKKLKLRAAWFGPMSAEAVAKANGTSKNTVRRFWKDEREAGRLPDEARPHFADRCKAVADDDVKRLAEPIDVSDLTPIHAPNPRFIRQCDALLAALRTHHADLDRPAAHHYATFHEWARHV
jgi:AcrR family transcriptional regulator